MKQKTMIWLHIEDEESICVERGEAEEKALEDGYGYERTHKRGGDLIEDDEAQTEDFKDLTGDELKELAKEAGIKGYANMRTDTLIKKLLELQDDK